MDRDRSR